MTWSPVTESNRRPSPYHACRFRPMASGWVGLPQFRGIHVSVYVGLRRRLPGIVVTWIVTGPWTQGRAVVAAAVRVRPLSPDQVSGLDLVDDYRSEAIAVATGHGRAFLFPLDAAAVCQP